jgi:hydrogenase nickel incorporation protein HypA/HybF
MHEYSVAKYALEEVKQSFPNVDPSKVESIHIKVGKMAGIIPDLLQHYLSLLAPSYGLTHARFFLEVTPALFKCNTCQEIFEPSRELFWCPSCGSSDVTFISGNELKIDYIEIQREE